MPEENAKDLAEIPDEVKKKLDIRPVARMDDVLKAALVRMPDRITWEEEPAAVAAKDGAASTERPTIAHCSTAIHCEAPHGLGHGEFSLLRLVNLQLPRECRGGSRLSPFDNRFFALFPVFLGLTAPPFGRLRQVQIGLYAPIAAPGCTSRLLRTDIEPPSDCRTSP